MFSKPPQLSYRKIKEKYDEIRKARQSKSFDMQSGRKKGMAFAIASKDV